MAPTIAGTNCLTTSEDAVVQLLASSPAFRTFVGATDEASAKAKIFVRAIPETDDPDSDTWNDAEWAALFPHAVITEPIDGEPFEYNQIALDSIHQLQLTIRFSVNLEMFANQNLDEQDAAREFMNSYGNIIEELSSLMNEEPGTFGATRIIGSDLYRGQWHKRTAMGDIICTTFTLERVIVQ